MRLLLGTGKNNARFHLNMEVLLLIAYISGFIGSVLLWFFGIPRKNLNRQGNISLILEQEDEEEKIEWKKYNRFSKLGILLIGLSFLLQILSVVLSN
ncbi:MAG: hypothetical protein WD595_01945 [Waddliaceae bacterium]